MLCTIKVNSNTIELTVHTSCYCVLDLLCVKCDRRMKVFIVIPSFLFLLILICFFNMDCSLFWLDIFGLNNMFGIILILCLLACNFWIACLLSVCFSISLLAL